MQVIPAGHLTVEEHVDRIRGCLEKTKSAIFETAAAIQQCHEQLGEGVFSRDVAHLLGMNPSTLSRWQAIGKSQFVMDHKERMPNTFTSLYNLTLLEKGYRKHYPKDANKRLVNLLEKQNISTDTEGTEIKDLIRKAQKKARQDKILSLEGSSIASDHQTTSLGSLVQTKKLFRTFVIVLTHEHISRWGDVGFFESEIQQEFPLHEIRTPSLTDEVTCIVRVPMKKIDVGIKVMSAFGFNYRDAFVPSTGPAEMMLLGNETVLVRGERGKGKKLELISLKSTKTEDVIEFCETTFSGPHILVFEKTKAAGWTCIES